MEVDPSDILTPVSPSTATGHRYHLTSKEVAAATMHLNQEHEYLYKLLYFVVLCLYSALMYSCMHGVIYIATNI